MSLVRIAACKNCFSVLRENINIFSVFDMQDSFRHFVRLLFNFRKWHMEWASYALSLIKKIFPLDSFAWDGV